MKVICVKNECGNANFTVGERYEITNNSLTCNFIKINMPKDFIVHSSFQYAFCEFEEEKSVELKQKIIDLGFTRGVRVDVEKDDVFVIVYFSFIWKKNNKISYGKEYFEGKTEEEVLKQIVNFASNRDKGDWILKLGGE